MPQLNRFLDFITSHLKVFYSSVLLLILSSLIYHLGFLCFLDLDFYHHVQNILFNILFIIFLFFCYKRLTSKNERIFIMVNVSILLFCLLQLQISLCEFINLYLYIQSDNIFFLRVYEVSALEKYIIPFYQWLLEGCL
jgi:hypothetical protein